MPAPSDRAIRIAVMADIAPAIAQIQVDTRSTEIPHNRASSALAAAARTILPKVL